MSSGKRKNVLVTMNRNLYYCSDETRQDYAMGEIRLVFSQHFKVGPERIERRKEKKRKKKEMNMKRKGRTEQ
jgi:hypothetical protein